MPLQLPVSGLDTSAGPCVAAVGVLFEVPAAVLAGLSVCYVPSVDVGCCAMAAPMATCDSHAVAFSLLGI